MILLHVFSPVFMTLKLCPLCREKAGGVSYRWLMLLSCLSLWFPWAGGGPGRPAPDLPQLNPASDSQSESVNPRLRANLGVLGTINPVKLKQLGRIGQVRHFTSLPPLGKTGAVSYLPLGLPLSALGPRANWPIAKLWGMPHLFLSSSEFSVFDGYCRLVYLLWL